MQRHSSLPATLAGWALFLDVDGTLLDIAATPDAVEVPPDLPDVLAGLARQAGGALALVSGRDLAGLDRLFGPVEIAKVALHGTEIRLPGSRPRRVETPAIGTVAARLRALADANRGLLVEDKGAAVAIHYRARPDLADDVAAAVRDAVGGDPRLAIQPGKMVVEVRPAGADKGTALAALMAGPPFAGRRPLAVGDDLTDEAMFAAAVRLGGLAVAVGPLRGVAAVSLEGPPAVRKWLRSMVSPARSPTD